MVTPVLLKNTLVKIRKSFGRYLSLLIIVLVGVGFFAGIQASAPDIVASLSQYNEKHGLTDFRVVSTMGLTDGDASALKALDGVAAAVPTYSLDVLDRGSAVRVHAIEPSTNTADLIAGRMPANDRECAADARSYKIGDRVNVSGDVSGKLKNTEFTVVGTVRSPLYLSYDYGNTTVGDGKLSSFLFVDRDNFTMDAYTEIDVTAAGTKGLAAYSAEYDSLASRLSDELVKLKPERENARYQEIYGKAADEIGKNEATLKSETAKAEKQLADAKKQLDASQAKLDSARKELAQNEAALQKSSSGQTASFQTARAQIADGRSRIDAALSQNGLTRGELGPKAAELNSAISSLKEQRSRLPADSAEAAQLDRQIELYTASSQKLAQLQASLQTLDENEEQLDRGVAAFNAQIAAAEQKIANGKAELAENQKKLDGGYSEYSDNLAALRSKMADAQKKIADAKAKLADIEKPRWTVLDRDATVAGYGNLKSGADTVASVAKIFPLFFILIVLLMTSNTMARMIAEEREELGTFSSLGFKGGSMTATYLFYVLSATVVGASAGFFLGCTFFPKIIYGCFAYTLPPLTIRYSVPAFLLILAVATALMAAVTVFFCRRELRERPAALMRPVPPQSGRTILLERAGAIWKRLSFTWKITLRNLFRYKQRVLMTVVGVAGCTALLLAGFGVRDSIGGVAQKQYGQILKYDDILVLKNETKTIGGDQKTLLAKEQIRNPALLRQAAFSCGTGGKTLDAYLVVPENEKSFANYFVLKEPGSGSAITLGDDGVVISQKLSEVYGVGKGGSIRVKDADNNSFTLPVAGVTENHLQNYLYMSKNLYGKVFGKPAAYNVIVSGSGGNEKALAEHLIDSGLVVSVNFKDDIVRQAVQGDKSLDDVVVLLVCVASLLAVIVLYNLTSINISERKREIATLKVLGFTDGECGEYIYREALLLTVISAGVGLLLGTGAHRLVMDFIQQDNVEYFTTIKPVSFVWAFLITMAASAVMQAVTYFKLKKIDMIESLKSVE